MSDRMLSALGGISEQYLTECESAWNTKALPVPPKCRDLGIFTSLGYVAMVAAALAVIVIVPGLLRRKPIGTQLGIETTAGEFETESDDTEAPETVMVSEESETAPEDSNVPCSHDYQLLFQREPTCTSEGHRTYQCSLCDEYHKDNIPRLVHESTLLSRIEPTCSSLGYEEYDCTLCSGYTDVIPMAEHDFADGICVSCGARKGSEGLTFSRNADGVSYTVTGMGTCTDTFLVIPTSYNGFPVTAIGDSAFHSQKGITGIHLPESILALGYSSFNNCTNLTEISIPRSMSSSDFEAFSNCSGLIRVILPDTITEIEISLIPLVAEFVVSPDNPAFISRNGNLYTKDGTVLLRYAGKKTETVFAVPSGVIEIATDAFEDSSSLEEVLLPEGLLTIGNSAFAYCKSLKKMVIPEGTTEIHAYAFRNCQKLSSVTLPNSLTRLGSNAFEDCVSLTKIAIPEGITEIDEYTFNGCSQLSSVTLPSGLTRIGNVAFEGCSSLKEITLPQGLTEIGNRAFKQSGLTEVRIPSTVMTVGFQAFSGCRSMKYVYCPFESLPSGWRSTWLGTTDTTVFWGTSN